MPKQVPKTGITDEEAHHMSPGDMAALQPFIKIVQAVADNPKLEPSAFAFYKKCVEDDSLNLETTLRSRCLSHMRTLGKKLGRENEVQSTESGVKNSQIIDWANQID